MSDLFKSDLIDKTELIKFSCIKKTLFKNCRVMELF